MNNQIDQIEPFDPTDPILLDQCLSLRQNLCLERDRCEQLLADAPMSWSAEEIHEYRDLREEANFQIEQLDRFLAKLQGMYVDPLESDPPESKQSRPWALVAFALLFLLFALVAI
jgi:hypothetical protein